MFGILRYLADKTYLSYIFGKKESDHKEEDKDNDRIIINIVEEVEAIEGSENSEVRSNVNFHQAESSSFKSEEYSRCLFQYATQDMYELCHHRVGFVTESYQDYAIIDHNIRVEYQHHKGEQLFVGIPVRYVVFRNNINEEWKFHKILKFEEENWDDEENKTEIVKKPGAVVRNIAGKVKSISDQEIRIHDLRDIFALRNVRPDFFLYKGDWLYIEALVEVDENHYDFRGDILAVRNIRPFQSQVITGSVTNWDEIKKEGIVDGHIWFSQNECLPGYLPAMDDKVALEAIKCSDRTCLLRARSIVLLTGNKFVANSSIVTLNKGYSVKLELLTPVNNGIFIPEEIDVGCVNLEEAKEKCLDVINSGKYSNLLLQARCNGKGEESQITLITNISDRTEIRPGEKIHCRFIVKGLFVGHFTEFYVFTFRKFEIKCCIKFEVRNCNIIDMQQYCENMNDENFSKARNKKLNEKSKIKMKGENFSKRPPFVKHGFYNVPENLTQLVFADKEECNERKIISRLQEAIPCLNEDLSATNYATHFHTLLYLEEIDLDIEMHKYDLEGVRFSLVDNEYLSLEVPNLPGKRFPIFVGDRLEIQLCSKPGTTYEGFIHKVCKNELWCKFHPQLHRAYESEECSVHFASKQTIFHRCHCAAEMSVERLGENMLFPKSLVQQVPQVNLIGEVGDSMADTQYNDSELRFSSRDEWLKPKLKLSKTGAPIYLITGRSYLPSRPAPKISRKEVTMKWFNPLLNLHQKEAVRNAVRGEARPLPFIVIGAPGTGKTVTLVETILQLYTLIPESRILVATQSNTSANFIAEYLLTSRWVAPGDLVRIVGRCHLEDGTLPEKLLACSTTCDLSFKSRETSRVGFKLGKASNAYELARHRITIGTFVALWPLHTMGFTSGHFSHICVDEADQATEPELLIPLGFLHKDWGQVILAGDPNQLGPILKSRMSEHFGLGRSYLERLFDSSLYCQDTTRFPLSGGFNPKLVAHLVMNYRFLPEIVDFVNSLFYDSQLQSQLSETGPEASILKSLSTHLPERDTPLPPSVVFHGVNGSSSQDGLLWYNSNELEMILLYLRLFYYARLSRDDIGVITPYQAQIQRVRVSCAENGIPFPKTGTVEEFRGQHRKVIILSTVCTSFDHMLEFFASPRKMNFAFTRARTLLIIVGNPQFLCHDPYWRKTLAYCINNNSYKGCDVPSDIWKKAYKSFGGGTKEELH